MNATLQFPLDELTNEQRDHIYKAASHLNEAGIYFDTGAGCGSLDWELDWSLKGAKLVVHEGS